MYVRERERVCVCVVERDLPLELLYEGHEGMGRECGVFDNFPTRKFIFP